MKNNKHILITISTIVLVIGFFAGLAVGFTIGHSKDADNSGDTTPKTHIYESSAIIVFEATGSADEDVFNSTEGLRIPASTWNTISNLLHSDSIREEIRTVYPYAEYELSLQYYDNSNMCEVTVASANCDSLSQICELTVSGFAKVINHTLGFTCKMIQSPSNPSLSN